MYLMVPHFFMIDVDCGAQALPIIAISTLNPSHISAERLEGYASRISDVSTWPELPLTITNTREDTIEE